MNDVVSELVSRFDTDRLGSGVEVRSAVTALLHAKQVTEMDFFGQPDEGVRLVWNDSLNQFPAEMMGLLDLAKAVAETSDDNKSKVRSLLINIFRIFPNVFVFLDGSRAERFTPFR